MESALPARPPFIGLTGGVGAGKTEALHALERLGAATLSSDEVVHELLATPEMREILVERLGDQVAPDGRVDRSRVASLVFADPDRRAWLESRLWPRVFERVTAWREGLGARVDPPRAAVVEVPLLFESGWDEAFDATVAVVADESLRAARAAARGHAAVESRSARQLSQEEKADRARFVVHNDGDLVELEAKMARLLEELGAPADPEGPTGAR